MELVQLLEFLFIWEDGHKVILLVLQESFDLLGFVVVLWDNTGPADPNCFYRLLLLLQVKQRIKKNALRVDNFELALFDALDNYRKLK